MIDGGKDRRKEKNMSFVNDLKNTVTSSRAAIAAAQEEAAAFERKWSGYYSPTAYAEKFAPVKAKTDAEILAAHKAIKTTVDDFRKQIAERYILKGDELTADAKLLESGVELNKADLTRMFDAAKAANNHTMMELAWRRSLKDGIVIERPYFSEKDLNDAANMMENYANSALSDSAYFGIWSSPGKLATITPAAVHDWDGTESPYRYVSNSNG